jgi:hypothetical protein
MQSTLRMTLLSGAAALLALTGIPGAAEANYAEGVAQSLEPAPEAVAEAIAAEAAEELDGDYDDIIEKLGLDD